MVNKLQRFEEIAKMNHVFEYTDYQKEGIKKPKGCWKSDVFKNDNPIILELGCGKAITTTALAKHQPRKNYVGIDIKGARIWKGAKRVERDDLNNAHFLRIFIEHLDEYFATNEVDKIWITFPDPYPRAGDRNKRLTSPRFLKMYRQILKTEGAIHLKTDSVPLFDYTLKTVSAFGGQILNQTKNLYTAEDYVPQELAIQTSFEKKHLAKQKTIKYCSFKLN